MESIIPLKIYADRSHVSACPNGSLNEILQAHWNDLSAAERVSRFGNRARAFEVVPNIENADLVVLPMLWNCYLERRCLHLAYQASSDAQQVGKKLVIFNLSDYPAHIPFSNAIVFEQSAYRSRRGGQVFKYMLCQSLFATMPRCISKGPRPVIGFCGQAMGNGIDFLRRVLLNRLLWVLYRLGLRTWEPAPFETTLFRKKILDRLEKSDVVETDFVRRRHYRAGYRTPKKDPFHSSRLEFVQNIINTDYTVCMRGGGNFSVRFYARLYPFEE